MYQNPALENLEIKLKNAQEENREVFTQVEKLYNDDYRAFIDSFFSTDVLGAKKTISALFQLEAFNSYDATLGESISKEKGKEILEQALDRGLKILPVSLSKRGKIKENVLQLDTKKSSLKEIMGRKTDFSRNYHYPILESLLSQGVITQAEMLSVYTVYQEKKDIRLSLGDLSKEKRDIVRNHFYEIHSDKRSERVSSFKSEYSSEISGLEAKYGGPVVDGVVSFVGRNFFKMKPYKKRIESRKMRLRRTFKIALLKLLRIKYAGFDVEKLIKKIDSLQDFESLFLLMKKLIDIIPENEELIEQYSLQEEVDDAKDLVVEAEGNKEKILEGEEVTAKVCDLMDKTDKKLDTKLLDQILDEDTDLVGDELKFRGKNKVVGLMGDSVNVGNLLDGENANQKNSGVLFEKAQEVDDEEGLDDDEEELSDSDVEQLYVDLKHQYAAAEKKKQEMFASGDFELLDQINDEILALMVKIEKVSKILEADI